MIGPGDLEDPPAAARLIDFDGMRLAGSPTIRIVHTHTPHKGHTSQREDVRIQREIGRVDCAEHTRDDAQHGKKMRETAR